MKGLYIAAVDSENPKEIGVINKIYGQINAFKNLNIEMDISHLKDNYVVFKKNISTNKVGKPSNYKFHDYLLKKYKNELREYDFVYIRFSRGDFKYYNLIKYLSKNNVKVVVEIPTYPYRQQYSYSNPKHAIYGGLDILIWKLIRKYIFRISVTNDNKEIEGIRCINISNGIDLGKLPLVKTVNNKDNINLVGIANLSKWHGYDRVIKGLYNYYENKYNNKSQVNFYIIGEGREKQNLMELTEKLELNSVVKFLGVKSGNDLDNVLNEMHIGVSSLALFRAGGGHDPIKTKEFLGRGLPVVLGYEDKVVNMNLPYVIKVPEDESIINIEYLVKLYEDNLFDRDEIRKYAEKNLSWDVQMEKIINAL